jgi:hypothetical protein
MNLENRKTRRRVVAHPAAVIDRDGSVFCQCTMKDVSATGAKLEVVKTEAPDQPILPDEFTLLLSKSGNVRRQCRISWRSENAIGVKFIK